MNENVDLSCKIIMKNNEPETVKTISKNNEKKMV